MAQQCCCLPIKTFLPIISVLCILFGICALAGAYFVHKGRAKWWEYCIYSAVLMIGIFTLIARFTEKQFCATPLIIFTIVCGGIVTAGIIAFVMKWMEDGAPGTWGSFFTAAVLLDALIFILYSIIVAHRWRVYLHEQQKGESKKKLRNQLKLNSNQSLN